MPKTAHNNAEKGVSDKNLTRLYDALLSLKTRDECAAFMRDLCTVAELKEMGERLQIARLVARGLTYRGIADEVGASTTTVTRVSHWFHHGRGGYPAVIARLEKK